MDNMIYAGTRKLWREWLRKNHKKESKVYLIKYKKHTGKPSLNNREAMEEAICFGWIDTTIKRIDDERYQQCFVKRNDKSRWSNNTIKYAEDLIKKRKMSKFGMEMYKKGKAKPTIDHNLSKNPEIPFELKKVLVKHKLLDKFKVLSPSTRRLHIYMIMKAKREETKKKRVDEVIDFLNKK